MAEVSLFNYITYRVSLCRQFSGVLWRPIRSGVHYDIERKIVKPLLGFSKDLVPTRALIQSSRKKSAHSGIEHQAFGGGNTGACVSSMSSKA